MERFSHVIKVSVALNVALILLFTLSTLASSTTYAAPHRSSGSNDCNNETAFVIVWYNNGATAWDDCVLGYTGIGFILTHVTEVETIPPYAPAWFKWYNGYTGKYCTIQGINGNGAHWYSPPGDTHVTQVDFDDSHSNSQCS